MAAVIVEGDAIMVTLVGKFLGQTTMNTYPYRAHITTGAPPVVGACQGLLTAINLPGGLVDTHARCRPSNSVVDSLWAQDVRPIRWRAQKMAVSVPGLFTDVDSGTANIQASIERYGEAANRHNLGAVRIPIGTSNDCIVEGVITEDLRDKLEDHADQMILSKTVSGTGWQVSFIPLVGLSKESLQLIDLVNCEIKDTVRVIRRRTVGLGI